jgi:hypothetical protein
MRALLLIALAAGCGSGVTEVDLTMDLDQTVTAETLAKIKQFHFVVMNAEQFDTYVDVKPLGGARQWRLVYRPGVSTGRLDFQVTALDDSGDTEASGYKFGVELAANRSVSAQFPISGFTSPGDGGVPDDGGGSGDGGASACPSKGVLFCDDFEGGATVDTQRWMPVQNGGTVIIDAVGAKGTGHSLKVHLPMTTAGTSPNVGVGEGQTFGSGQNPLYVRFYLKVANLPSTGGDLVTLSTGQGEGLQLGWNSGASQQLTVSTFNHTPSFANYSAALVPSAFTCLEWKVDNGANASSGSTQVWMNDTELTDLAGSPISIPGLVSLVFGTSQSLPAGTGAFDIWFDEILVDTKQIGCSK